MFYTISGILAAKKEHFFVVEAGGVGYKLHASKAAATKLPSVGTQMKVFCYLAVKQDALDLYGFLSEKELELFERLISVSGVGPKSALNILGVAAVDPLVAAINEGKIDLLTRVSGVGKKTAERVILELKGKLTLPGSGEMITLMESDVELEETLVGLGYTRAEAKAAVAKIDPAVSGFKERLKEALKKTR